MGVARALPIEDTPVLLKNLPLVLGRLLFVLVGVVCLAKPASAGPPQAPAGSPPAVETTWTVSFRDTARLESWRFFEPQPGGGNPDYSFFGNRMQLNVSRSWSRIDFAVAGQHVGLAGLPAHAVGPGALGTGPLYFAQSGKRSNPQQLYLRYATLRFKHVVPGVDVLVGRQAYASGGEAGTTDSKIEAVRRQRLNARLVGEFEWSLFQRGYDGVRIDWRRPAWQLTAIGFAPTQGGFAKDAGKTMGRILVGGATFSTRPSDASERHQLQGFVLHYADDRPVRARPDNSGQTASAIDVAVTSIGGTWLGAHKIGAGDIDTFVWVVGQTGTWYQQDHRAWSLAAEAGYQWTSARWTPWIRAGLLHASGDDSGQDDTHGTFFPMLPTMRRFSQTTAYSTMNLNDLFAQVLVRPSSTLSARLDIHRLRLASASDLWYAGSGATLKTGTNQGFSGRRSNGSTDLGTSFEASADWSVRPRWSVNGFVGAIRGGNVVRGTFRGGQLWFAYAETAFRFDHKFPK